MSLDNDQRKRKRKFSQVELDVLAQEVKKHSHDLQQKNININKRHAVWEKISARVNAVGKTRRTTNEIKRRWQDLRRRTKEMLALENTSEGPAEDEQQVQITFCDEHLIGIPPVSLDSLIAEEESSDVVPSPQPSPPHTSCRCESTGSPAEPPKRTVIEDIDEELLQEQKNQSAALKHGLSSIVQEVRSVSSVTQGLREDTQAIVAHTRQLVSAVSGLTTAIHALAAAVTSLRPNGPTAEQPEFEEGGAERTEGETRQLRKRK